MEASSIHEDLPWQLKMELPYVQALYIWLLEAGEMTTTDGSCLSISQSACVLPKGF